MTATILAVIALTGALSPAAKPEFRAQTDYGRALKQAADEKKPMAVLIGKGDTFGKLLADAGLSAEAKKLLSEKYVCVSVDVETASGKELAGEFRLADGLIISTAGGSYQALRQAGAVTAPELAKHTAAYANETGVPATTVTVGTPTTNSVSYYPPVSGGPVVPAGGYTFPASPYSGGGCPNGRCPNAAPRYVR